MAPPKSSRRPQRAPGFVHGKKARLRAGRSAKTGGQAAPSVALVSAYWHARTDPAQLVLNDDPQAPHWLSFAYGINTLSRAQGVALLARSEARMGWQTHLTAGLAALLSLFAAVAAGWFGLGASASVALLATVVIGVMGPAWLWQHAKRKALRSARATLQNARARIRIERRGRTAHLQLLPEPKRTTRAIAGPAVPWTDVLYVRGRSEEMPGEEAQTDSHAPLQLGTEHETLRSALPQARVLKR